MARQKKQIGKYRIEGKLGEGGFATVYRAMDMVEGDRVALKIVAPQYVQANTLDDFRKEVRIVSRLRHPNILPLKNADLIDGLFVMAFPLGEKTLADRLQHRLSATLALDYLHQLLSAVSHAHHHKVIHCDIKPENLILFPGNQLLLSDFGIAKVAQRTVQGSGAGTIGHVAPEQAMGKPSFRSDVFSIGLIAIRMFSGHWPEWPFAWPPPGYPRLRERLHPDFIRLLRRSIEVDPRKRFRDATQMLSAFRRIRSRAIRRGATTTERRQMQQNGRDWRTLRHRQFQQKYGKALQARYRCHKCHGPVAETMQGCPWCGEARHVFRDETRFPQCCPRCHRGMKLDWVYCPWCYGPGFQVQTNRHYSDARYQAKCSNPKCKRRDLMPFMRYCPWCSSKVRRVWKLPEANDVCRGCGWGIAKDFWSYCPWCQAEI